MEIFWNHTLHGLVALRLALCPASSILFCLGNKIVFTDHRGLLSRAGVPFILQSEEGILSLS